MAKNISTNKRNKLLTEKYKTIQNLELFTFSHLFETFQLMHAQHWKLRKKITKAKVGWSWLICWSWAAPAFGEKNNLPTSKESVICSHCQTRRPIAWLPNMFRNLSHHPVTRHFWRRFSFSPGGIFSSLEGNKSPEADLFRGSGWSSTSPCAPSTVVELLPGTLVIQHKGLDLFVKVTSSGDPLIGINRKKITI